MKIKNPFVAKNWTIGRVLLVLWLIFATAFMLYSGWGALNDVVFREGVQRGALLGQNETITRVIQLSQKCNTVNLFSGEGENRVEVSLVDSTCSDAQIQAARDAAQGETATVEAEEVMPLVEEEEEVIPTEE